MMTEWGVEMNSNERIIDLFIRLMRGQALSVAALATKYHVTSRTMQRDLASIRDLLAASELNYTLVYQRQTKKYILTSPSQVQYSSVLALLKILVGTRALNKVEVKALITQQLALLSGSEQAAAKKLLTNSLTKYVPVGTGVALLPRLKQFANWIEARTPIKFGYRNSLAGQLKMGQGLPVSLYFAEFYFYVVLYTETNDNVIYRLDRFETVVPVKNKALQQRYDRKLDEGDFLAKTVLLSGGHEVTYTFRYWSAPQTALDRLPHSKIIKHWPDHSVTIKANSFEQGALMWLLGQGSQAQVLSPQRLVSALQQELAKTLQYYQVKVENQEGIKE